MFNERQIELLPERITSRLTKINTEYLKSIGEVIKDIGELRPSDVHKLQRMYSYGTRGKTLAQKLAKASETNRKEIYEIFDLVAKENYNFAKPFYEYRKKPFIPYEKNESLKNYVKSLAKQTVDEYVNLTQHTAFAVFDKGGKSIAPLFMANKDKAATSLSDTYTKVIDYAVTKVQFGVTDYNSAMRECLKALADSGIKTVDYATGYSRRLDTAVRQNILWGIKECNQNVADFIGEDFGADGYEISYHSHPRESHEKMAGKQYAKGKARTINGVNYPSFSDIEHLLKEYNCLHFKFSIILGVSEPAYNKSELAKFKAKDKKKIVFEDKEYTKYEASQLQRRIETEVRHQKDRSIIAKAAGDTTMQTKAQLRINQLTDKYAELSDASGLPTKMERMNVKGFKTINVSKTVDKFSKSGIIEIERSGVDMLIDKFTPCLEDAKTGEILQTSFSMATRKELKNLKGWNFDWTHSDLNKADVYKLTIDGSNEIQGLIALTKYERDKAMYVNIVESAPHNLGVNKRYNGVGGHLYAVAVQKSLECGYGGFVFMDAKNIELVEHYKKTLGAVWLGRPHEYRMFIDEESARKLIDIYTLKEG